MINVNCFLTLIQTNTDGPRSIVFIILAIYTLMDIAVKLDSNLTWSFYEHPMAAQDCAGDPCGVFAVIFIYAAMRE